MSGNDKIYDAIISLGGFCGAAMQLRMRGLRTCAMPFDWLYMNDARSVRWLTTAFETGNFEVMSKDTLRPIERKGVGGMAPYKYEDTISGYGFIHHFYRDKDCGGYEEVHRVFERRMARFLACLGKGGHILLILATPFSYDVEEARALLRTATKRFPSAQIDLHVMQLSATFDCPETIAEAWPKELGVTGGRFRRTEVTYDLARTSFEWSFLDHVRLRNEVEAIRGRGFAKIVYKLWKWSSTWLLNRGCGCYGMKFRGR